MIPEIGQLALVLALLLAGLAGTASADGGMWMPQQIPALAERLRALGFEGDPQGFAELTGQPMGAIVSLGGCSASFVSSQGLIVTNHHCVTGGLQFNSTPQRNLLTEGFLARTREEELSNGPGSRVFVTTSVTEVTAAITGGLDAGVTDRQRNDTIDRRVKERVAAEVRLELLELGVLVDHLEGERATERRAAPQAGEKRDGVGLDPLPASTGIQARLCREDLLVEIEAIAVVAAGKPVARV